MLTKVVLKNFQSHKHLEVDCAGFTTLTGGSNGGKSAVLRAIQGLVRNDSAADYVRHGQKTLSVTLEFEEGFTVEWIKGSGENKYILTGPDGSSRTFDKVGSDVPDEVKDVLKLGPIAIKGSDKEYVNFHNQLESPFLIGSTPGSVAKLFGELTSASDLYTAVSEGNRQSRSTNALKTTRKTDYEKTKDSLDGFSELPEQLDYLNTGKALFGEAQALSERVEGLGALMAEATALSSQISTLQAQVDELLPVQNVDLGGVEVSAEQLTGVQAIMEKIDRFNKYEEKAKPLVESLEIVVATDIEAAEADALRLQALTDIIERIDSLGKAMADVTAQVESSDSALTKLDARIHDIACELDVCPTCRRDMTDEAREAITEGRVSHAAS